MRRSPARRATTADTAAGFTLFEMVVTMLIISSLLGVTIMSLDTIGGADLKHSARRLAGTVRSLRDEAALRAATIRLAIDLDEATYQAEMTEDPFGLYPTKLVLDDGAAVESDEERQAREEIEDYEEANEPLSGSSAGSGATSPLTDAFGSAFFDAFDVGRVNRLKPAVFRPLEGRLHKAVTLPGDVVIDSYWAQHQEEIAEKGMVFLYFFPTGMTETAVIYLSEEGDADVLSLTVQPLTGEVTIEEGRIDLPEEEEEEE